MKKLIAGLVFITASQFVMCETVPLYRMQENVKSDAGATEVRVPARSRMDIYTLTGEGVINRIWGTTLSAYHKVKDEKETDLLFENRGVVINFYWDNSDKPAISAPLGDFFAQPFGFNKVENKFFTASSKLRIYNCLIPMPFRKSARIEIVNDLDTGIKFFTQVDVEYKKLDEKDLYLHGYWHRKPELKKNDVMFVLPEVIGKGRYLGTHWANLQKNISDRKSKTENWYIRPVSFSIDASKTYKKYAGALDDYLCSAWWANENPYEDYNFEYTGRYSSVNEENVLFAMCYRYHVTDPVWFNERISMRVGKSHCEVDNDWSSLALFYLDKPTNELPAIQDVGIRTFNMVPPKKDK